MNNSIFKKFGLLFFVLVLSVVMAACGDDEESSSEVDNSSDTATDNGSANTETEESTGLSWEITVWAHPYTDGSTGEGDMWKTFAADFEAETGA